MENNNQNIYKDQYGNLVVDGVTYYSKDSLDKFTTSLQNQNNDLMNKFNELNNNFNALQTQINDDKRSQILLQAGIDEAQLSNVKKIMSDIPNEQLLDTLQNDRSLDIFRTSKFKEQQPKNEEPKSQVEQSQELNEVEKALDFMI